MRLLVLSVLLIFSNSFVSTAFVADLPEISETNLTVYFDTDESKLKDSEMLKIDKLFANQTAETIRISLVGHTDNKGSDNYNVQLSKRRVERVKAHLIKLGYNADLIEITYKGEKEPDAKNDEEDGRAKNRRVTISWEFKSPEITEEGDIRDLYKLLEQEKQEFCINPNRDTILTLQQGTIVVIPAGSFKPKTTGCVTFRTKEIYKTSDMLMENLTTTSNGRVLETGGMIYTEAFDANGDKVELQSKVTLFLPTDNPQENMELFSGKRQGITMNWNSQGLSIPYINLGACGDWYYPYPYKPDDEKNSCDYEPLFFKRFPKRVGSSFKGMFDKTTRMGNKSYRQCQRNIRDKRKATKKIYKKAGIDAELPTRYSPPGVITPQVDSSTQSGIYSQFSPSTYQALRDSLCAVQKKKMEEFFEKNGVESLEEYYAYMRKLEEERKEEERKKMEEALEEGKGSVEDLQYYTMQITGTGWANCDVWSPWADAERVTMPTSVPARNHTNLSLIVEEKRATLPASGADEEKRFNFKNIATGVGVWLLGLKFVNGDIFLMKKRITTRSGQVGGEFKQVTLEELKRELRSFD